MHELRASQRRMLMRWVPKTRRDAGDVAFSQWGVDYEDTCRQLRATGRGALDSNRKAHLAVAITGGLHTQQRMSRAG
eukprot:3762944-Alexandrium_andersonii.AAC.1